MRLAEMTLPMPGDGPADQVAAGPAMDQDAVEGVAESLWFR